MIKKIREALPHGGVFVFNFFGKNGDSVKSGFARGITMKEVKEIFKNFRFIHQLEYEENAKSATGPLMHWHMIRGVVQKL